MRIFYTLVLLSLGVHAQVTSTNPAIATNAAPTYGEGQRRPLSLDLAGGLRVNITNGAVTVTCTNCGGSTFADNSAFTAGTSTILNVGGVFNDGLSAVTSGNAAAPRITSFRAVHFNLRDNSGNELGIAAAPLRVDPTGSTAQPVTGTFWQATQPISAASLPLPSGASTAAKQPALGTAGTPSADVISIQGVSSMTAVKVDGSAVTQPVSAASLPLPSGAATSANQSTEITSLQLIDDTVYSSDASIDKVVGIGAQFDDTSPGTTTENNVRPLRMSTRRELYGQIRDAAGNERGANVTAGNALVVDGSATTQPISAASLPLPSGASTAAKQPALGTAGSASSDVITVQGIASMTALKVDGSGVTQPVSGTVTANAGTNLNTSALALESGGNLATVAGAVRAEDAASADGHTGIGALAVRKATPANTSGADGDYEFLQMSAGRLWTSATIDTALPTGSNVIGALSANQSVNVAQVAGTNTVTGGVSGLMAVGGNVANGGTATANPVPVGGIFQTTPTTLTNGQTATAQYTAAQNLKTDLATIAGTAPTTAGKVDVKGADGDVFVRQATASNLNATVVGSGTAGSPAGGILTIQGVASMTKLLVTPDSVALPANQSVNAAQIAGTNTVTAGVSGLLAVGGAAASGASKSGNPVQVGGVFNTTPPTVTTGQAVEAQYTNRGEAHVVLRDAAGNLRGANVDANNNLGVVLPAETTKVVGTVRVLGNGGATVDSTIGAGTAPANQVVTGAVYNSTEISPSAGQAHAVQSDSKGRIRHVLMDAAGNTRGANVDANNNLGVVLPAETTKNIGTIRVTGNVGAVFDGATGAAPPANVLYQGGNASGATGGQLAGAIYCDQYANINQTGNTQVITGVSGRRTYICQINLVVSAAQNVAVVAGTGTVCATSTVAVPGTSGGTTAATGWNLAANSGIVVGGGANTGPIAKTTVNADNVCILQSGSAQVSGGISYAIL